MADTKKDKGFKSKAAVFRWLQDNDREISRSHFYDLCKDGVLKKNRKTKTYTMQAVKRFAKLHTKDAATGEKEATHEERLATLKKEVALKREEVRLAKEEHELLSLQKKNMPVEDHELGVVARGIAFLAHLKHTVIMRVPDYIDLVSGDQEKAAALVDALTVDIEKRMGIFDGSSEFEVILEADSDS